MSPFFFKMFEGLRKVERHIPSFVFDASYDARMSFLAGMIDADGNLKEEGDKTIVRMGSTNEELALQEMALAQSLGYQPSIYLNHYTSKCPEKIRYMVVFEANLNLVNLLASEKKRNHFANVVRVGFDSYANSPVCNVVKITPYEEKAFQELYAHNFKDGLKGIPCFYCRGAWNEAAMSLPDRTLCHLLMKSVEKKEPDALEPWERALVSAAGKSCDWTDRSYLEPLIDFLKNG